jgi:hypothetical protein
LYVVCEFDWVQEPFPFQSNDLPNGVLEKKIPIKEKFPPIPIGTHTDEHDLNLLYSSLIEVLYQKEKQAVNYQNGRKYIKQEEKHIFTYLPIVRGVKTKRSEIFI